MGFLFLFTIGILAIILLARIASKSGQGGKKIESPNGREKGYFDKLIGEKSYIEEGLVSLLIKKGAITEEELLNEIECVKKLHKEL